VHEGPYSAGCIAIVDRFLDSSPGQWLQLLGNHERVAPASWAALDF
jgi:hypothetical protein